MNKKFIYFLFAFSMLLTLVQCNSGSKSNTSSQNTQSQSDPTYQDAAEAIGPSFERSDVEIVKAWKRFLAVVTKKDKQAFKSMACSKILCYDCVGNSFEEQKRLDSLWQVNRSLREKIQMDSQIPVGEFIREDFDNIFTNEFVAKLKTRETYFGQRSDKVYEVLITTLLPTSIHDGGQHDFTFKKRDGVFKLCAITTIP